MSETSPESSSYEPLVAELCELVRTQPKIPVDDPRVALQAQGNYGGHDQFLNNFFRRFETIDALRSGKPSDYDLATLQRARGLGVDLMDFYQRNHVLCNAIIAALNARAPYQKLFTGYVTLVRLEVTGQAPAGTSDSLNAVAEHPLGFEAIGCYYWDQINPLLEQAFILMNTEGVDVAELGR